MTIDDTAAQGSTPPGRKASVTAIVVLILGLVVIVSNVWWTISLSSQIEDAPGMAGWFGQALSAVAFLTCGTVIVGKQPRNVIGWLLLVPGLFPPLNELVVLWLGALDPVPVRADPIIWIGIWFTGWSWILLIFPLFLILLTFPTGRLLTVRWRWVVALIVMMSLAMMGLTALSEVMDVVSTVPVEGTDGQLVNPVLWSVANPIGRIPTSDEALAGFFAVWFPALIVVTLAGVAAVVLRFRRGSPVERQQLKWPLLGLSFFGILYAWLGVANGPSGAQNILFSLSLVAVPVSVAVAVLKYRLYEIDRIISRTVSYALVAGLLAAVFFAVVTALSTIVPAQSDLAIVGSTLAVAATFNPLRTRIHRLVGRRFNRSHYVAEQVMNDFESNLRDRVDPDAIIADWLAVVTITMQPAAVGAWTADRAASHTAPTP